MDDRRRRVGLEEEEETLNRLFGVSSTTMNNNNISSSNNGGFYPSSRRFTTNPSSESSFIQNPYSNPVSEETLFFNHLQSEQLPQPQSTSTAAIEDALSRLTFSPSNDPYVDVFGNPIINNNDYYMGGGGGIGGGGIGSGVGGIGGGIGVGGVGVHHLPPQHQYQHQLYNGFNPIPTYQAPPVPIDYQQRMFGCPDDDWVAKQIMGADYVAAASQMNQVPRRSNAGSVCLNEAYLRMMNGGGLGGGMSWCGCGNPLCPLPQLNPQQVRRQSASVLAEQFRRGGSLTNSTNGYRQHYTGGNGNWNLNGNRSRRNEWEQRRFELSRSTMNNRNRFVEQSQYAGIPLADCRRRILTLAQDQNGCRYLQTFFEEGKLEDVRMIFSEVIEHVGMLMMDPFGNYLVQKMLDVCTQDQLTQIIRSVTRINYELVQIAMDVHGNCCVQKLLSLLKTPEQISLVLSAFVPGVVMMTRETNGHHVLTLCLKIFSNDDMKYILKKVEDNCVDIATEKSGCCILQQVLEHTSGDYRERLISLTISHALLLAQDPFGNYVVQYLLQQRSHRITDDVLRQLKGSFISLSIQKCSSNVVQRCLNESTEERAMEIIREMIDSSKILMLFQDQYGNYVAQTALEVARAREHIFNALADQIRMHYQSLRSHPFGKRVISKLNELSRRDRL